MIFKCDANIRIISESDSYIFLITQKTSFYCTPAKIYLSAVPYARNGGVSLRKTIIGIFGVSPQVSPRVSSEYLPGISQVGSLFCAFRRPIFPKSGGTYQRDTREIPAPCPLLARSLPASAGGARQMSVSGIRSFRGSFRFTSSQEWRTRRARSSSSCRRSRCIWFQYFLFQCGAPSMAG